MRNELRSRTDSSNVGTPCRIGRWQQCQPARGRMQIEPLCATCTVAKPRPIGAHSGGYTRAGANGASYRVSPGSSLDFALIDAPMFVNARNPPRLALAVSIGIELADRSGI